MTEIKCESMDRGQREEQLQSLNVLLADTSIVYVFRADRRLQVGGTEREDAPRLAG